MRIDPATLPAGGLPAEALGVAVLDAQLRVVGALREQATVLLLDALAAWDDKRGWLQGTGASPRTFLVEHAGCNEREVKALIALARDLHAAPAVGDALRSGVLPTAKARLVAAFACQPRVRHHFPDHAAEIITECAAVSLAGVPVVLATWQAVLDPDGPEPGDRVERRLTVDHRAGRLHLGGDLYGADAALVADALEHEAVRLRRDAHDVEPLTHGQARADALVTLVRRALGVDLDRSEPNRPVVHLDIDLATLEGRAGRPALLDGEHHLSAGEARTLCCDAEVHTAIVDGVGRTVAWGHTERFANRATRRALAHRDEGCRFPGCSARPADCVAHHIVAWEHGGPTSLANLVLLCPFHHRCVHVVGWTMERLDDGELRLGSPGGDVDVLPERKSRPDRRDHEPPPPDDHDLTPAHARRLILERLRALGIDLAA